MSPLRSRTHWIFDLDGTLTVAMHDFDALRDELQLPRGAPILESLRAMPAERAEPLRARVDAWEQRLSVAARAQPGAAALLRTLEGRGARLGLLTRNTRASADRTLEAAGLAGFFEPGLRVGRGDAAPKPAPDGVLLLLDVWGAAPDDAVLVGDTLFDVQAGRAAGVATVWLDSLRSGAFTAEADCVVHTLGDLLGILASS